MHGKVFGTGAGSTIGGYRADRLNDNPYKTFSTHIMAGFLPFAEQSEKEMINNNLQYFWDNGG